MTHDVFLSYSSKNKTIANAVCAKLEENGIRVWIAPRDVPAGTNFAEAIVDAIEASQVLVVIWSADANMSKHVLNEISQAFDKGIPIIPFRIQEVAPTRAMSYYISNTHWLDAIDPPLEKHISKLMSSIRAILGEEASDQPSRSPSADEINNRDSTQQLGGTKSARGGWRRLMPFFGLGALGIALILFFFTGLFGNIPAAGVADLFTKDTPTPTHPPRKTITPWPSSTPRPTPTLTPVPDWIAGYAEPILAAIQEQEPVIDDDFSDLDPRWQYRAFSWHDSDVLCPEPASDLVQVKDGSLILSITPDCPQSDLHLSGFSEPQNFVWQSEIDMQSTTGTIELQTSYPEASWLGLSIRRGVWQFLSVENHQTLDMSRGGLILNPSSTSFTVTIINQCPYYLVYIDSDLRIARNDLETCQQQGGSNFTMWNEEEMEGPEFYKINSIKFWELGQID